MDNKAIIVTSFIAIILSIVTIFIQHCTRIEYTYYFNEEFGTSNECFIKDDNAYCVIDDVETKVDLYYEVEE